MHQQPTVREVELRQPRGARPLAGNAARGRAASLLRLQRTAGNRAVGALIGDRPRVLARCGERCRCGGACKREDDEEDKHLAGPPRLQRVAAAAPSCPTLPDPLGEWRTQRWLCEMRKAPIGDNSYTLATKGQRGAKGDARGRSVELVHQVLAHWLCHRPDVAARLTTPVGDRYTAASAAAVAAFQAEFSEPGNWVDGIVGPSTLNLLDYYIHGGPVPSPAECGDPDPEPARPDDCGDRTPGEEEHSAKTDLFLDVRPPVRAGADGRWVQDIRLTNFTIDDWSLDKGPSKTLDDLAEFLEPDRSERDGTALECWKLVSATVFGFADCHEEPSLGALRAERVRDEHVLAPIVVEIAPRPMTKTQRTEIGRRLNRSVLIKLELEQPYRIDFSGSVLDDLLAMVESHRDELLPRTAKKEQLFDLAALLARDSDPDSLDHQVLDRAAAIELSSREIDDGECEDWSTYEWKSARKLLGAQLASLPTVTDSLCGHGALPVLEDVVEALDEGVLAPMQRGIKALLRLGGWNYTGSVNGCACLGFRELRRRAKLAADIYSVFADDDDPVWERDQSILSLGRVTPRLCNCYPAGC